jgi:leader peptidase (prepilin peptidase)/N-methyltransferase
VELMGAFAAALAFAPGLAIGSFLNVVAARLPVGRSIVHPPSACLGCEQEIAWYDNIPVVSWLLLGGRCRNCASTISVRYPLLELVTALLVAACFWKFGVSGDAVVAAFTCIVLVAISAVDIEHRIIPNKIVLPAAAIVLVANTLLHPSPVWVIAAFGASGFLFAAALAYPKGMGMGDVKLALLMGAAVGRAVPVAMMIGMMAALVPGIVLLVRHGSAARKMGIPFGPFLALGTVVALFAGPEILHAYWSIGR